MAPRSPTFAQAFASDRSDTGSFAVFGPGLVGSYLGAAGGARVAFPGPSALIRCGAAELPNGLRRWDPRLVTFTSDQPLPVLVCSRVHRTPWDALPANALATQNGLGQPRSVAVCFFAIDRGADDVLRAVGPHPRMVLAPPSERWEPVLTAWADAGITIDVRDDVAPAQWEKAILNATVGPLCLATGLSMGEVWGDARLRCLVLDATREGGAIARAEGVAMADGLEERAAEFFGLVGQHRPSVLADSGELPHILGYLLAAAVARGVEARALASITRMVAERDADAQTKDAVSVAHGRP
jgi:hypothetical protein